MRHKYEHLFLRLIGREVFKGSQRTDTLSCKVTAFEKSPARGKYTFTLTQSDGLKGCYTWSGEECEQLILGEIVQDEQTKVFLCVSGISLEDYLTPLRERYKSNKLAQYRESLLGKTIRVRQRYYNRTIPKIVSYYVVADIIPSDRFGVYLVDNDQDRHELRRWEVERLIKYGFTERVRDSEFGKYNRKVSIEDKVTLTPE